MTTYTYPDQRRIGRAIRGRQRTGAALFCVAGLAVLSSPSVAQLKDENAALTSVSGTVIVQRGQVYIWTEAATDLKPGDTVIVLEKSKAALRHDDCAIDLPAGSVYTVTAFHDCDAAAKSVVAVEPSFIPAARKAPGTFEVDLQAAERALERTLTQAGALLLPIGKAEVTPSFGYTRRESSKPLFASIGSDLVVVQQSTRRSEYTAGLGLKVGLPWESQLEMSIPYNYVDSSTVADLGQAGRITESGSGGGLGDFSVGIAKTLLREQGWRPDLIARVGYDTGSGTQSDGGVALSGGFRRVSGQLSVLKRQDPLAFVGGLSYATSFEKDNVEPGDEYGFSFGTVLAASPETSLQFRFSQTYADDIKVNGRTIDNTDQTQGLLSIGASSILGRGMMLNVNAGIGLNDSAPDYFFNVSLPVRFDVPEI